MKTHDGRPAWWQLYLLGLGMIGLLLLGALAPLSELGHQVAAIGALLVVCGLVELWLRANTPALLRVSKLILEQAPRPEVVQEKADQGPVAVPAPGPLPEVGSAQAQTEPARLAMEIGRHA